MKWWLISIFLAASSHSDRLLRGLTPGVDDLRHVDLLPVAQFGDAEHRGHKWYDSTSSSAEQVDNKPESSTSSETSSDKMSSSEKSSDVSSIETNEMKKDKQVYRVCTPCPQDMIKRYKNKGIKWICGGYQRARRSFKSECMMRYRNCQDGTLFVKVYDHQCKNDSYHGKHWFYIYRT